MFRADAASTPRKDPPPTQPAGVLVGEGDYHVAEAGIRDEGKRRRRRITIQEIRVNELEPRMKLESLLLITYFFL